MKFHAIMFMCNDFARAKFTLENFRKHNPNVPVRVINSGGDNPLPHVGHISLVEVIDAPNLWVREPGSFDPRYYDYLFEYGLMDGYTHTMYLETDVLTNREITKEPKYDIAGVVTPCGGEAMSLYYYLNISDPYIHTGTGGTMFSRNYFLTIKANYYHLYQELFDKLPKNYYMDLVSTLVARKAGLSWGDWEEISNIPIHFVNGVTTQTNMQATLVHNYKV